MARRFEVFGTKGSAILLEPFEPGGRIRLALDEARSRAGTEHLAGIDGVLGTLLERSERQEQGVAELRSVCVIKSDPHLEKL